MEILAAGIPDNRPNHRHLVIFHAAAQAEAAATKSVSDAIEAGSVNALNYFVAQKYVEAFAKLADSPQQRTVIVPTDMGSIAGAIAGITELINAARPGGAPPSPPPPRRPAAPAPGA